MEKEVDTKTSYIDFPYLSIFKLLQKLIVSNAFLFKNLSDKNLIRLISLAQINMDTGNRHQLEVIKECIREKNSVIVLARNIFKKSKECRTKLISNFFFNAVVDGREKRKLFSQKFNLPSPFFFVVSPTMQCNLACKGCYAGKFSRELALPTETLDRIFSEAKLMGIYFITISGGEPFMRKDLLDLFQKHNDMYFQVYTNGTIIDKSLAQKLARLGNVAPVISVEGLEKETDKRRGKGVHKRIMKGADALEKSGVLFGFSAMATSENWSMLASDNFYEFLCSKGFMFGWIFQHIPIGKTSSLDYMLAPAKRLKIWEKVKEARKKYPLFVTDFWNDGEYVNGCLAGGRSDKGYFHINAKGDVEPCVFAHFAEDNINTIFSRGGHLWDALRSKLFSTIRDGQPWCADHRMPCMIIDNPDCLRKVIAKCPKAYPTEINSENLIDSQPIMESLDTYSSELKNNLKVH